MCAVQSRCRRILQDGETGNIVRLKTGQVTRSHLNTVDKNQRAGGIREGGDATDKETGIIFTRLSTPLVRDQPGDSSGQGCGQVGGRNLEFRRIDGSNGGKDALFLLGTESDNDTGIQVLGNLLDDSVDGFCPVYQFDLVFISEAGKTQHAIGGDVAKGITAIKIRNHTVLRPFHKDGRTDHGLALRIQDSSGDRSISFGCSRSRRGCLRNIRLGQTNGLFS